VKDGGMKVVSSLLSILLLGSLGATQDSVRPAVSRLRLTPAEGLMNEPVSIEVSGLAPRSRITVVRRMTIFGNRRSHAIFVVDAKGQVRLRQHAPVERSPRRCRGMGPFSSMPPEPAAAGAPHKHLRSALRCSGGIANDFFRIVEALMRQA
jgi:hypothetical protein